MDESMVLKRHLSRRTLLRLSGAMAMSAALDVTLWQPAGARRAAVRTAWTFDEGIPATGAFETPELQPGGVFDAVDLSWLAANPTGAGLLIEIRTRSRDGVWTEWSALHPDTHAGSDAERRGFVAPALRRGNAVQARVTMSEAAALRELTVGVFDAATGGAQQPHAAVDLSDGFIVPRAGWGADDALRHEDQDLSKPIIWPPEYQLVEKIIVHHSATDNDPPDPAASVRAIYYYHAVTRGWGDIGYNYLVDQQGTVYEGRIGGPNVIGGHALRYNPGSMGVSFIGNFDVAAPSDAMIASLARLVHARAAHVDVTTASDFVDLLGLANFCGHSDLLRTSCPGEYCVLLMPWIRGRIAGTGPIYLDPPIRLEWLELIESTVGPATIYQSNLLEVRIRVLNNSISTIYSSGPDPGFIYDEDEDYESLGFPKVEGTYRFTLDFDGNAGVANPWRWGFGEPIAPGEEREVVGYVRLRSVDTRVFFVGIVEEFVRYLWQWESPRSIRVGVPPVGVAPRSTDSSVRYFSETGHNVPEPFASFWDERGRIQRFGYPLTEAFDEVSETDGGVYLTQYFERARMEDHPDYAGTEYEVQLGLLGTETTRHRRDESAFFAVGAPAAGDGRLYFPETGHTLGGIFRAVWEARGGLRIFGYPISEELEERSDTDGVVHVVQYFERNRFEHHPDYAGTEWEVMLGHLGREVLIRRGWLKGAPS
jgi:hypothetical protein